MMEQKSIRALDFFCGAGGLTRGLLNSGIHVVAGIDVDANAQKSYERNNIPSKFICKDIRNISARDLQKLLPKNSSKTLLAGCAPCQPFSTQRKGQYKVKDASLLSEFGRAIEIAKPDYVMMENVPGLARVRGNSTFRRFLALLDRLGYFIDWGILDAKQYGVPQSRRRLVLVACRYKVISLPKPGYGKGLKPCLTVRDAISHFPVLECGSNHEIIPNHVSSMLTDVNLERIRSTPHNGGSRKDWPEHLKLTCHSGAYTGHTDVYGRMSWDGVSPTLTGKCNSLSNGRYGHPEQDRAISLREAAALQTFPDNYTFFGPSKWIAQHIGNAVPVRLAEAVGKHLLWHEAGC